VKFKHIYILIYVLFFVTPLAFAQNSVKISFNVSNVTETTISAALLMDQITDKTDKRVLNIGAGSLSTTFQIYGPSIITLGHGLETFELYATPGDDILVTFDGLKFSKTLYFSGQGSIHNNFLKSFKQEFFETNDNVITYKINSTPPLEYKQWITDWYNKRIAFLTNYNEDEKKLFSQDFKNYAFANIDYWYAYHLLRYKSEHVSASVFSEDIDIPFHYYDFLNKIIINNDNAMSSKYYRNYLEYYLPFREENLESPYGLANEQIKFEYQGVGTPLMNMPFAKKSIGKVNKGTKLLYLNDKMTYTNGVGDEIAYRIKVKTDDGQEGWMKSNATQVLMSDTFNCKISQIEKVKWTNKMVVNIGIVTQEKLRLMYDPFLNSVVTTLNIKDTVFYMNQRTTELLPYRHDSTFLFTDRYYKVRTQSGKIGWISGGCFVRMEKEMVIMHLKDRIKQNSLSAFREIDRYFSGKSKVYLAAKDIARRVHFEHPDSIKTEFDAFMADHHSLEYRNTVSAIFDEAKKHPSDVNTLANVNYTVESTKSMVHNPKKLSFKLDPKIESLNQEPLEVAEDPTKKQNTTFAAPQTPQNQVFNFKNIDLNTSKCIIKGNIKDATGEKLSLNVFANPLSNNAESFALMVSNGSFEQSIEISQPVTAELVYGGATLLLYLEPGDDININMNGNSVLKTIRFTGKGAIHCQYLKDMKLNFENTEVALKNNIRFNNPSEFKVFMAGSVKDMQQYYANYPALAFFSDGFKNFATAQYNYWFAFNMLNFAWEHPLYYGESGPMELSAFYYDFLQQIPSCNDQSLGNKYYSFFVDQFLSNQKRKPEHKDQTLEQVAEKYLTGRTLALYKTKIWNQNITNGLNDSQKTDFQSFMNNVQDPILLNIIKKTYFKSTNFSKGSPFPSLTLTDNNGKIVKLDDYRGKVIYLDIWATWCGPCLNYIKKSQDLKARYKEGEVEFLYISIDGNRALWQQYLTDHTLNGIHLFGEIDVVEKASVRDVLQINQLPVFFLVDKAGNIATDPKQRPDNEQIATLIQQLLAK
jgi:thiol-disulfide isomerase/thioredoxin